ncbi:hypothetical protein [Candidatus Solincola sp.]|jgi:hypothetical protein|nr:hypothetical protein [Actinomycetota bacterium]MDI7253415.1 hypothetical protein [Actinomycetota bacterium]
MQTLFHPESKLEGVKKGKSVKQGKAGKPVINQNRKISRFEIALGVEDFSHEREYSEDGDPNMLIKVIKAW